MASKKYACADEKICVACGACRNACPKEAISIWHGCYAAINSEICIGCGKCERICPAGCIKLKERT